MPVLQYPDAGEWLKKETCVRREIVNEGGILFASGTLAFVLGRSGTLRPVGVLKDIGPKYIFTKDYLFDTASPAAIVVGYSINGKNYWKNESGNSLNDMEKL